MKAAALLLALVACGPAARPPEPLASHGGTVAPPAPAAPVKLELVEGTPWLLPDGTVVNVKNVMYAHMTGPQNQSLNESRCTLVLTRGVETKQVDLVRIHGGETPALVSDALGWRFTVEMADPYHQPAHVIVNATKL